MDDLKTLLAEFDVESAAETCGIPVSDIHLAASYIGKAKGFCHFGRWD